MKRIVASFQSSDTPMSAPPRRSCLRRLNADTGWSSSPWLSMDFLGSRSWCQMNLDSGCCLRRSVNSWGSGQGIVARIVSLSPEAWVPELEGPISCMESFMVGGWWGGGVFWVCWSWVEGLSWVCRSWVGRGGSYWVGRGEVIGCTGVNGSLAHY